MCGSIINVKISLIAIIAIGSVVRDVDAKGSSKIIGGKDAEANEFPWMARLNVTDEKGVNRDCGGAIISSRHILTTAYCLENVTLNSIWTGSNVRDYNVALKSRPAKIILHPDLKRHFIGGLSRIDNNIGIVVLDKSLQLGKNQNVIKLAKKVTAVNTRAVLAGWGITDERSQHTMVLQPIPVIILPTSKCFVITTKQLCGRPDPAAAPHESVAGSPLVAGGRIIGLLSASWGMPGQESMYIDIYHYRKWIKSSV